MAQALHFSPIFPSGTRRAERRWIDRPANDKGKTTMKPDCATCIAALALSAAFVQPALAQTAAAPAAPAPPEHSFTANVGLFSEYIFRGIAQTGGNPAIQGGFDYAHASGFYAGTWASNISWLEDFGAYHRSSVEWDVYGGYRNNFPGSDFFYDLGAYGYLYPGSRNPGVADADTWELYGALGWKWASVKFSYSLTDYFGARPDASQRKTDGTWYIDASATYPIGETGFAILAHVGHLDVRHDGSDSDLATLGKVSYTDWKFGASYTVPDGLFKNVEVGAYYTGNDAKSRFYTDLSGYNTARDRGVVYVKKTF
jgi:uncharacterized protein (TIGR02001 family)